MTYTELKLRIGSRNADSYPVFASSPRGECSGCLILPFPAEEIEAAFAFLDGRTGCPAEGWEEFPESEAKRRGRELFDALFHGPVGELWNETLGTVSGGASHLELSIELDPRQEAVAPLLGIPWELLYHESRGGFLSLRRRTPIVRRVNGPWELAPLPLPSPLRILCIVGEPPEASGLKLAAELKGIEGAVHGRRGVEVMVRHPVDLAELTDLLRDGEHRVLHFMGHGRFVDGKGTILLPGKRSLGELVLGDDLARTLADTSVRLVILNACETASASIHPEEEPFSGVATALLNASIPAVVAMQRPIKTSQATIFAVTLYRRLLRGEPLELAVTEARVAMRSQSPRLLDWAIPVLFSRAPGAVLFTPVFHDSDARQALGRYLKGVADLHRYLEIPSPSWLDAPSVAAADLFVEPRCRRHAPGTSQGEAAAPFDEIAGRERYLAILGEAGSGKTTLLGRLAVDLASRAGRVLAEEPAFSLPFQVPVPVQAADLAAERRQSPSDLGSCIGRCLARLKGLKEADSRVLATLLPDLLDTGKAVLLIDGLDEIGDPATRLDLLRELDRLAGEDVGSEQETPPGPRLVVTSRMASWPTSYRSDRITRVVLEPFGSDEIGHFLTAWARSQDGPVDLESIIREIVRRESRSLVENPWHLSLLCWLIQQGRERIPRCRAELYKLIVDALLDRAIPARIPLKKSEALKLLAEIATRAQERWERVDAEQVEKLLEGWISYTAGPSRVEVSRTLLDNSGFFIHLGGGFHRFRHKGFQEYLAAQALEPEIRGSIDRMLERMAEPCWREPLRLAMGCAGLKLDAPSLRQWLRSLIAREDLQGPGAPRPALFLAATLAELREVPEGMVEELAERLLACAAADVGPVGLHLPIGEAFVHLLAGDHAAEVRSVLIHSLRFGEDRRALTAARLVRHAGSLAGDAVAALPEALRHDEAGPDRPVEAALRDIATREPERLPDSPRSLRASLRRRKDLQHRVLANPSWLRLILAVYGGFAPGAGFRTERIHRDSPLTHSILRALEKKDPPHTLIPELQRLQGSSAPFDAAMALLALGGPAQEEISQGFLLGQRIQARLSHLRDDLRPLVAAALAPCLEGLGELAGRCDPERWSDLLAAVLRVGVAWGGPPAALFRLGSTVPPGARAAVLAEIWHVPLVSGDPVYHFTLLLDVMGDALSNPPWLLAESLARAGNAVLAQESHDRGWNPPPLAPLPRSRRETLAATLDSLAALASPFDFVRGWALARLAPLLAAEGWLPTALTLATESLSDRFGARKDALVALRAQQTSPSNPLSRQSPPPPGRGDAAPRDETALLLEHADDLTRPDGAGAPLLLAALLGRGIRENPSAERLSHRGVLPLDRSLQRDGVTAEQEVSELLASLEEDDDLRRHEALLALAGDRSDPQRSASTAALGPAVLSSLARERLMCREDRPWIAQVIDLTLERVRHDDGAALAAWGSRLAHEQDAEAEVLLSRIHDLHPRAWPAFRSLLHSDSLPLQQALLRSLCYLAARRRLSRERWDEIAGTLRGWAGSAAQQEVFLPEGPLAIARAVEVACEAGENPGSAAAITAVELALQPFILPLADTLGTDPQTLLERLEAVGSIRITPARRSKNVALAADRLEKRPQALPILLAWLVHRFESEPRDPSPFCPVTGSLLGVAAAVAERMSPDTFRQIAAQRPDLDRCLRQATETHDSHFGRRAALELLARLGRLTPETMGAVRSAIHDVPEVQASVLATAPLFDSASFPAVKELARALHDPSVLTVHVAAEIATALVRSGSLPPRERDLLAEEARKALETSGSKEIWFLGVEQKRLRPRCLGLLADSLTHLQLELAGLGLFRREEPAPTQRAEGEMKGVWLDCEIDGRLRRLSVHIGRPAPGLHPFKYQAAWMTEVLRARILPSEVQEGSAADTEPPAKQKN